MPSKTYYLDGTPDSALTAKWGLFFRNFELLFNGQSLGVLPDVATLRQGQRFELPDGRTVTAQLVRNQGLQELELLLDGRPVPGSGTHPLQRIRQAWYVLLFIGLLNIAIGLVAEFIHSELLQDLGLGWSSLAEGVLFMGLGWWGFRRQAPLAFFLALGLLIVDWLLMVGSQLGSGQSFGVGGIFLRFFFCVLVFRGARGAQELQRERQDGETSS